MNLLETTICDPGTHFTLGEDVKDGTFIPGSSGFMGFVLGAESSCPNVLFYKTLIVRKGKRGKDRLEHALLPSQIFKLPGVPADFLVPPNEGRKYFVDMVVTQTPTPLMVKFNANDDAVSFVCDDLGMNGFVGCLKAKVMFLRELDKTTKAAKHPLVEKIGESGTMQSVWPEKQSRLYTFEKNVESMYSGQNFNTIRDEFCTGQNMAKLFREIHSVEAALMIPLMEYHNKVETVAEKALVYIMDKLNSPEGKKLKNVKQLVTLVQDTMDAVAIRQSTIGKLIDSRMNCIYKNRVQLAGSDGPF